MRKRVDQLQVGDKVELPGALVPLAIQSLDPDDKHLDRQITHIVAGNMQWKLWPDYEVEVHN